MYHSSDFRVINIYSISRTSVRKEITSEFSREWSLLRGALVNADVLVLSFKILSDVTTCVLYLVLSCVI